LDQAYERLERAPEKGKKSSASGKRFGSTPANRFNPRKFVGK